MQLLINRHKSLNHRQLQYWRWNWPKGKWRFFFLSTVLLYGTAVYLSFLSRYLSLHSLPTRSQHIHNYFKRCFLCNIYLPFNYYSEVLIMKKRNIIFIHSIAPLYYEIVIKWGNPSYLIITPALKNVCNPFCWSLLTCAVFPDLYLYSWELTRVSNPYCP